MVFPLNVSFHPSKARSSILVNEEGISIIFNAEHSLNKALSIDVTAVGIFIFSSDVHSQKGHLLISLTEEGIETCFKEELPSNSPISIVFIEEGISKELCNKKY